jgi:MFS family permease
MIRPHADTAWPLVPFERYMLDDDLSACPMTFTVTWLVEAHGMSLTAAGSIFAAMQLAGVAGRLVLGWAADRMGDATRSLALHGLVAAALTALWVVAGPGAPMGLTLLLAAGAGFTAASWNGIFLAEVARVVPADRVAEASSGAILLCFLGYLAAPSAFALAVAQTGSWLLPFLAACALLAVASKAAVCSRRQTSSPQSQRHRGAPASVWSGFPGATSAPSRRASGRSRRGSASTKARRGPPSRGAGARSAVCAHERAPSSARSAGVASPRTRSVCA